MSAYADTLAWLYGLELARGMDFKLERVALALAALGDPHRQYPTLHIAGTNGKGSVAAMLHAMLREAGRHVGLYTSPHLERYTERMRIGDREISEAEVVELTNEIRTAATVRGIDLTFFEFGTVMAFLAFARHGVEGAVIEVGLGGRLDATNVIDPDVTAITTIGRDHEEFLGTTIESIAGEKAGIIKAGRPVVIGRLPAEAEAVVRRSASARAAPVVAAIDEITLGGSSALTARGLGWQIDDLTLGLRGRFQRDNAAVALAVAAQVRDRFGVSDDSARRGLAAVRWPGRLEVIAGEPTIVLDGGHNEDGIATLVSELPAIAAGRPIHVLFAVMRDKPWPAMVARLGALAQSATVTSVLPPRGEDAERVAAEFRRYCVTDVVSDARDAARAVRARVARDAVIVVAGSLFLVGAVGAVYRADGMLGSAPVHV